MKTLLLNLLFLMFANFCFSQNNFSAETKKYIVYDEPVIALQHAVVIDGTGNAAKTNQTIIINNGKIDWVGDDAIATIPKNAKTVDLKGKAITPGWVMLHEHMYLPLFSEDPRFLTVRETPVSFPRLYLACGATTIRTTGCTEPYTDLSIKRDIELGRLPGPHIDLTAPYLEGENTIFDCMAIIKTPDAARKFVDFWADQGFTSFKAYMFLEKPQLKAAVEEAHKYNLKITGHLGAITYREAATLGIDQLEHGFSKASDFVPDKKENIYPGRAVNTSLAQLDVNSDKVKSFLNYLIDKHVAVTSTLAVMEGFKSNQPAPSADMLSMFSPDNRDYYLKNYALTMAQKGPTTTDSAFVVNTQLEKMFHDMGGLLTVGTDPTGNGGTIAGYGNWRAIELLVEADGFTPIEAIKIATLNGAKAMERQKTIGTIEVGKNADLIVIDGDPSKDIHAIRKVIYVFKDGVGYDSQKLINSVKGKVGLY